MIATEMTAATALLSMYAEFLIVALSSLHARNFWFRNLRDAIRLRFLCLLLLDKRDLNSIKPA